MPRAYERVAPLTPDQRRLAESGWELARRLARMHARRHPGLQAEIDSAAGLAVIRAASAAHRYPSLAFTSQVYRQVEWAVRRVVRDRGRHSFEVDQPEPIEVIDPAPPATAGIEADDAAERLLSALSPRDAAVVRAVAIEGRTFEEVGRDHGLSDSWAHQRYCKAIRRLRDDPVIQALAS